MSVSLVIVLTLAVAWCLVIGEFSLNQALLGFGFGAMFTLVTGAGQGRRVPLRSLPQRLIYLAAYVLLLIPYDIVRSNLDLAWRLLRRRPAITPGIVRLHLGDASEITAALVAHAITMTPGEMVVDYSADGRTLYIHVIDTAGAAAQEASFWLAYRRLLKRIFE